MILKYQQGGSAVPPLVSYQPVTVTGGRQEAPVENDQENANLTDKDLLTMLEKLDGLPSDMAVLTQTLQNFYIDQQYDQFPNTSNIASRYLQALSQMKEANFNKKEYDETDDDRHLQCNTGSLRQRACRATPVGISGDDYFDYRQRTADNLFRSHPRTAGH